MPHWIHRLLHNHAVDKQLDAELQFHLEQQIADNVAAGMTPEEARRLAQIEMGGVEQVKQKCRDAYWENWIENIWRDLRFAVRSLRKDWHFALTAIFALALGIGACTVVFSVVYNGLISPFPYRDASRLATFFIHDRDSSQPGGRSFTSGEFLAIRAENHTFEDIIGLTNYEVVCANEKSNLRLNAAFVTPNSFQFLGVHPFLGRVVTPADANLNAPPVFAMNYRLWQKHFNTDPKVLGSVFVVDGVPRTLVAIMPPRFQIDTEGSDIWIPNDPAVNETRRSANAAEPMHLWWLIGRLKPGVNTQIASADPEIIARQLAKSSPDLYPKQFSIETKPLVDVIVGSFKQTLYLLIAAVTMLFLITCTNVANLLLARAVTREKEVAIRVFIGASRGRLVWQLLLESWLLAVAGGVAGSLLALGTLNALVAVIPPGTVPDEAVIALDPAVLIFTLSMTALTTLLCGLVSTIHTLRIDFHMPLQNSAHKQGSSLRRQSVRSALVVGEVALSLILLICAGLMIRTFVALRRVNLGFNPSHVLVANLSFPKDGNEADSREKLFFEQALQRIRMIPGVLAATSAGGGVSEINVPGRPHPQGWAAQFTLSDKDHFRTLEIPLIKGRLFTGADDNLTRHLVVINQTLARDFFGGEDPIGRKIKFDVFDQIPDAPHNSYFEIVGIVADTRNRGLRETPMPEAYIPSTIFSGIFSSRAILVKTTANSPPRPEDIQRAIWSADPNVSLVDTSSLDGDLQISSFAEPQFGLITLGTFAGIGLLLAIIGIFSVMAYTVSLQTHDIGIRLALGAQQADILRMVLKKGLVLIAAGIVIGVGVSLGLTRFIASQLWGVSPTDPWTFAAVVVGILVVGLAACFLPARRATQVDPVVTLRYE